MAYVDCGVEAEDFDFEVLDIQKLSPFGIEQPVSKRQTILRKYGND